MLLFAGAFNPCCKPDPAAANRFRIAMAIEHHSSAACSPEKSAASDLPARGMSNSHAFAYVNAVMSTRNSTDALSPIDRFAVRSFAHRLEVTGVIEQNRVHSCRFGGGMPAVAESRPKYDSSGNQCRRRQ